MASKKKNPIHGLQKKGLLDRKWFPELIASGPAVLAAAAGAYKASTEPNLELVAWMLAAGCVWLSIGSIIKVIHAKRQDSKEDDLRSHDGLVAALHVLHEVVAKAGGLPDDEKAKCLRATFHRVLPPLDETDHIEQIVPYVGGDGGGAGRKFPIRSGITGKAIREKAVFVMDRQSDSYESYKQELIKHWHYTESDVRNITSDRYSAIAVPVQSKNGQDILGVVYLDCSEKNFFSPSAVSEAVVSGCTGIVRYTGERYV